MPRIMLPEDRDPVLPIYRMVLSDRQYEDGADFLTPTGTTKADGSVSFAGRVFVGYSVPKNFPEIVNENDVVTIPLFQGTSSTPGDGTAYRLPSYRENIAIMKDLAPSVKGVMVGNGSADLSFKHYGGGMDPVKNVRLMCDFVEEMADLILGFGGRPFFGTMDWDTVHDCYFAEGKLKDLMTRIDAVQISFCGFTLVPGSYCNRDYDLFANQLPTLDQLEGGSPYTQLMSYIAEGPEMWTGMNGMAGIRYGNDIIMSSYGFKAGVVLFGGQ